MSVAAELERIAALAEEHVANPPPPPHYFSWQGRAEAARAAIALHRGELTWWRECSGAGRAWVRTSLRRAARRTKDETFRSFADGALFVGCAEAGPDAMKAGGLR